MIDRPWLLTSTGRAFYPDAPEDYPYSIRELALGLSRENRFGGHTFRHLEPYTVAQHSVVAVRALERFYPDTPLPVKRAALLHDAAEGMFWKDLPSPIKHMPGMAGYRSGLRRTEDAIFARFGLSDVGRDPRIKIADEIALETEKRDVRGPEPLGMRRDKFDRRVLPETIRPWPAHIAEQNFVAEWVRLGGEL